jgi:hypothetical protein
MIQHSPLLAVLNLLMVYQNHARCVAEPSFEYRQASLK